VCAAKSDGANQTRAGDALEKLCRTYRYPLNAFVRSRGYAAEDAQDRTQAFFTRIIETGGFASADSERGRFRSYLLGAMKRFRALINGRGANSKNVAATFSLSNGMRLILRSGMPLHQSLKTRITSSIVNGLW